MAECSRCGQQIGFFTGLFGRTLCGSCGAEKRTERDAARSELETFIANLALEPSPPDDAKTKLGELAAAADTTPSKLYKDGLRLVRGYLESTMDDDVLSESEEQRLAELTDLFNIDQERFDKEFGDLVPRLFVAKANDGRLPEMDPEQLTGKVLLKAHEVAHLETNAALMKLTTKREYQAGYGGFSFRLAKGVRFHTGRVKGKSVVTGTELKIEDEGTLTITSARIVFRGAKKTIEVNYKKLIGFDVFEDGIQVAISGRQTAPMFKILPGISSCVAAAVNTAYQRSELAES